MGFLRFFSWPVWLLLIPMNHKLDLMPKPTHGIIIIITMASHIIVDTMAMATDTDTDTMAARNVMLRLTPLSSPQHLLSQHLKFMPTPMPMDILITMFH